MLDVEAAVAVLSVLDDKRSARTLREWSYSGALPRLQRLDGGDGHGRGPAYGWDDAEMVQIYTISHLMRQLHRLWEAKLHAWWAGFEYPVAEMRDLWIEWSELEVSAMQRQVVETTFDPRVERGTVLSIPDLLRRAFPRLTRKTPPEFFDVMAVLQIDPIFDARTLSERSLQSLRHDLAILAESGERDLAPLLEQVSDDAMRRSVAFVHRYFSPAALKELLGTVRVEDLEYAHADWQILAGAYRWWLHQTIVDRIEKVGGDHKFALAYLAPNAARLGRAFILADLAIRQAGYGEQLDETLALVRGAMDDPAFRMVAQVFREGFGQAMTAPATDDEHVQAGQRLFRELAEKHPEVMEVGQRLTGC